MRHQRLGPVGLAVAGQIIRAGQQAALQGRPDRDRDHIAVRCIPQADPGVVAAFDNIGHAILAGQVQPDRRIGLHEAGQFRPDAGLGCQRRQGDAQRPFDLPARVAHALHGLAQPRKRRVDFGQQPGSRFGQAHRAAGARDQLHAELIFQRPNGLRHRRRRHPQLDSGNAETAERRHGAKDGQAGEDAGFIHAVSLMDTPTIVDKN